MSTETDSTHNDQRPPLGRAPSLIIAALAVVVAGGLLYAPRKPLPVTAPVAPVVSTTTTTTTAIATSTTTTAVATTTAQQPTPTPPADEKLEPGLTIAVERQGSPVDKRTARVLALYVPEKESPTPFLDAGPFTATFTGYLNKDVWDNITFSAEGAGALTLTVNDKPVLEVTGPDLAGKTATLRVNKGKNKISVVYKSPAQGDAHLRVLWSAAEIPTEPLPATLFTHNIADKEWKLATRQRLGRELVGALRCTKCHATDASADTGLPELATDAPDLREVGARLNAPWMAAWIRDPKALRAHATMPRLGAGKSDADLDKEAGDMAAYLATLGKPAGAAPAEDDASVAANVAKGGQLFVKLACVTCHAANGDAPAHIDISRLKAKWQPSALVVFLKQPSKHYTWIRMPEFGFSEVQAQALAAFLLKRNAAELPKPLPVGDAARGKALVATNGCVSCHQVGEGQPLKAPALADLGKKVAAGCLATDDAARGKAPDFGLEGSQLSALRSILATDLASLKRRDRAEFADRRVSALRCNACHERDGVDSLRTSFSGVTDALMADLPQVEQSLDETHGENGGAAAGNPPPLLTFTGDKLRPEWMTRFIAGKIPYRPRPWLDLHMPAFPAAAELLAQGLVMGHGKPPVTPAVAASPGPSAADGERVISGTGGFACQQCHGLGSAPPVAVFEAPGINLGYAPDRLQKDYFHRWMMMPLRFDPTTRMPKFAQDDGTTPLRDILDGKAHDQFEAVWQFLTELNKKTDFPQ